MSSIDSLAIELFEQSKRFFEIAIEENDLEGKSAYLNAALLIGVSALEAHINAIADEFIETWNNLNILEKSILQEKEFQLEKGEFVLKDNLKMYKIIERIEFIFKKFARYGRLDKSSPWWNKIIDALKARNELVHPRKRFKLNEQIVEKSLQGILELLNNLYKSLYNKPYPSYGRGLDSKHNY